MTAPHGTRTRYQHGPCRCLLCRAANAAYETEYRRRKRLGLVVFGALVPAGETQRQLRLLSTEYQGDAALAQALGYRGPQLQFRRERVTVRNALKVRRLYRLAILDGLDLGNSHPSP